MARHNTECKKEIKWKSKGDDGELILKRKFLKGSRHHYQNNTTENRIFHSRERRNSTSTLRSKNILTAENSPLEQD